MKRQLLCEKDIKINRKVLSLFMIVIYFTYFMKLQCYKLYLSKRKKIHTNKRKFRPWMPVCFFFFRGRGGGGWLVACFNFKFFVIIVEDLVRFPTFKFLVIR